MIEEFKDDMTQKYEMSDMGLLRHFLGMEIYQEEETIFICQKIYAEKILKKFNMLGCNPVSTPLIMGEKLKKEDGGKAADVTYYRSLIGNLLYLTATRPDLMYVASLLSRFMQSPSHFHLGAAKRVLRYVQGTTDLGLSFQKNHALNLVGYCDSDLGGSLDDMKSTSGYCFSFGSAIFSWVSKKQQSVAQSSAEAEYISASVATSQAIWLRKILADLGHHQIEGTVLHCDNKSAIAMAKNPVHHNRTRHIALKHHFIRQAIEDKEIQLDVSDGWVLWIFIVLPICSGGSVEVAPVPDSSTTSEALEVPMSPSPNLMELGNPRCVHLADGLIIQLNQNPCLKSIPNHGKLYEFVAMKYDTSRSDIVSCNSCSTESSYDSSMSSESFDVQRELQEMREEHGEELSTVGDI
ncbi:hypothetical protein ZIOFF_016814 [Zingiber officinale]|uniref:Reverse transcriptase Ty1/copia-type domain-containing protein n=1 Tax=Zingiber officinale TaxID=94328 RepID=A0A8J5LI25_ZINOF|nr:hypothetical protein ZIOFF_016814 [Zingiber officinale]